MHISRGFAAALLAALLWAPAFAQGRASAPSVADFVRNPEFTQVSISPDGRYLAALTPKPDHPHQNVLVVFDAATAKPLRVLNSGAYQLISDYVWVGQHRLIGTLAIQLDGLDTPIPTGELYAIDADGSRPINLFGFRAKAGTETGLGQKEQRNAAATVISTALQDGRHVLIATRRFSEARKGTHTDIEKLDVMTGSSRRIGTSPARNAHLVADHDGVVRVAYASDDFITARLWTRATDKDPWRLVNDPDSSGVALIPIGFNRDNSKLYVESSQGDAPDAIELMDMTSGKRSNIYQGRFADPLTLLPSADRRDYYAVITADGEKGLHYIDKNSLEARLTRDLATTFKGRLAYFSSFSGDQKLALIRVESDRNSGDYYLMDMTTHRARYVLSENRKIDPNQMRPMQPIALHARDGLPLHGFMTLPAGVPPFPTVVLVHGGPFGISDQWEFDPETQLFASRGYAVLQVNYRGSGGYGSNFLRRGFKQWGRAMQEDVTDATRWAIRQGTADPNRICIYGASYGGYAAMEAVVREPDLYRCAIGYAGVYDMRVQLSKSDVKESDAGVTYMHETMGDDPASLLAHSPLSGVGRIKANLLLIHGGKDERVPFSNFREFTQALDARHKKYETLIEPHEGHGFFVEAHRIAAYRKMIEFLDRNIGADRAKPTARASAADPDLRRQPPGR